MALHRRNVRGRLSLKLPSTGSGSCAWVQPSEYRSVPESWDRSATSVRPLGPVVEIERSSSVQQSGERSSLSRRSPTSPMHRDLRRDDALARGAAATASLRGRNAAGRSGHADIPLAFRQEPVRRWTPPRAESSRPVVTNQAWSERETQRSRHAGIAKPASLFERSVQRHDPLRGAWSVTIGPPTLRFVPRITDSGRLVRVVANSDACVSLCKRLPSPDS